MKISLIQPGRNNLKYLKWSYDSIRKNQGDHEVQICVADDASTDGTWGWCQMMMREDPLFKAIRNEGPTRLGHTILYDKLVNETATSDICMIWHADMYLCPGALDAIEKHLKEKTIISLTRIEPPLHPPGPEKVLQDFGIEPEEFDEDELLEFISNARMAKETTEGIFAPWAFWKKDFQEIGGHDEIFAPQSKEDSDIFNRFQLNGIKFVQTWEGFVYHMTCRGSRFADGATRNPDGQVFMKNRETDEWLTQNQKATRNFIRKWGHFVKHDSYLKPIIPPKYDIGFVVHNCNKQLLHALEPWCSRIYHDAGFKEELRYIKDEQPNTLFDMDDRVITSTVENKNADIFVEFDGSRLTNERFQFLQRLPEIIQDSGEIGKMEYDIFKITIKKLDSYEKTLINCNNTGEYIYG